MKTWSLLLVAVILGTSPVRAADKPDGVVDHDKLKELLEGLGHKPKEIKAGTTTALQIELKHASGETRKHLLGFDPQAGTVFIIGGGFSTSPDPKKASNEWFRKLLKINNNIAPNYIFLNEGDVFGLTTVFGNVNVTEKFLKAKIELHLKTFDDKLVPLIKELTK